METSQENCPWLVTPGKVDAVVRKIIEVVLPVKIILFGSYPRSEINRNSDLDVLVIADDRIANTRSESIRIRRALRGISMPMDVLVVRHPDWTQLKDAPGLIYREAAVNGKVVYEAPGK